MKLMLTKTAPTPGEVLRGITAWLKVHPKTRYLVLFVTICTICYLFLNDVAWASTEDKISARTFGLPLEGITDSSGVPIWRYQDLPMDPGNGPTYIERKVRKTIASLAWAIYSGILMFVIGLVEWIVSFEWLAWIAAPFELIATGVSGVLDAWMLIPLGVLVSSVWIAVGYLRGRTGAATIEFLMVALVFGIITSPIVDPLSWMSGSGSDTASENGLIQRAADVGAEAGAMTVNQDEEAEALTLSGVIIDVGLRDPMLRMAFGSPLDGDCADEWNQAALDFELEAEDIRKEVIKCSDAVADANQTDSYVWVTQFGMAIPTGVGVIGLLAVFIVFLAWQVWQAMWNAIQTVIQAYFALYPGNSRTNWLKSMFNVLASIVLIGIYVFALVIYVWLIGQFMNMVPPVYVTIGSAILGLVIILAAISYWRMRRAGKKLSEALAQRFGRTGLSKDATPRPPSNFGSTVKNVAKTGANLYHKSRMLRAAKTGATVAAAVGTAGAGAVAAKAGTAMASNAVMKAGAAAAAQTPAATHGTTADHQPQRELPAGPDQGTQQAQALPAPEGPNEPANTRALPPHTQGQVTLHNDPTAHTLHAPGTTTPSAENTPPAPPQQPRVNNIPEGNYGNSWVHKNGQVHSPMTIRPDGTPVKNIPNDHKINKAFVEGDSWVTSTNVKNFNPSPAQAMSTPTPMRARGMGEAPSQGGK